MDENGVEVKLYIYDLSMGLAQPLSQLILRKHLEGIWHTSIVIFGREYYYGQSGISICEPGCTNLGNAKTIERLGKTYITEDLFQEYLNGLKQSSFAPGTYDLLKHNCNTFSNELSQFLVGENIPKHILDLPDEILEAFVNQPNSPVLTLLSEFVTSFRDTSPDYERLNNDIDAARRNNQN